jgi:elongation factor G
MVVDAVTPERLFGNVIAISPREGKDRSPGLQGNAQKVTAKVPLSQMFVYATSLRQIPRDGDIYDAVLPL